MLTDVLITNLLAPQLMGPHTYAGPFPFLLTI